MITWLRPARKVSDMDGFKDTTRMKYMMGGDVKAYKTGGAAMKPVDADKNPGLSKLPTDVRNKMGYMKKGGPAKMALGGTLNEKGKRATLAEMEAEDRRMGSSMPAKKAVGPSSVAVSKVLAGMTKKAMKKAVGGGVFAEGGKRAPKPPPQFEGVRFIPGDNDFSGGLTAEYVDYKQKQEEAAYQARMVADAKMKKAAGVKPPLDTTLSSPDVDPMVVVGRKPPQPLPPTRGPSMSPTFNDRPMIRRKTGGLSVMPKGKR